jgi:hypothetical protein
MMQVDDSGGMQRTAICPAAANIVEKFHSGQPCAVVIELELG